MEKCGRGSILIIRKKKGTAMPFWVQKRSAK
jgi:hypothetical protein